MQPIELYLGLDVHKDSTTIAIAQPGPPGEVRLVGTVSSDIDRLEKALRRIGKAHPGASLEVAYEAGPCAASFDPPSGHQETNRQPLNQNMTLKADMR